MPNESITYNDTLIPRAGSRAKQFLGVIHQRTTSEGLDVSFRPTKRSMRDSSIVLRGPLNVGRGNAVELEVYADPQGSALHVGWVAQREALNGVTQHLGLFQELNWLRNHNAGTAASERALNGILQAFDGMVFRPVVELLVEAVQGDTGPQRSGFLGA